MAHPYYNVCRTNIGRGICVTTRSGRVYRGVIGSVDGYSVGIRPLGRGVEGEKC
jgi:small nuclear ribonucleoprotein (snRNP)-like protein